MNNKTARKQIQKRLFLISKDAQSLLRGGILEKGELLINYPVSENDKGKLTSFLTLEEFEKKDVSVFPGVSLLTPLRLFSLSWNSLRASRGFKLS